MNINDKKLIDGEALEEWKRVVLKPLRSIYKWTLALTALMTLLYKPTAVMEHMEFFKRYMLYPALALALVIIAIEIFFSKFAKKLQYQMVALAMVLMINLYVAINLFAFGQLEYMMVVVFFPIVIAPVYREKKLLYLQVGISLMLLLVFEIYIELNVKNFPETIPFRDIFVVLLLFYAMVKLELEVVTSANMLGLQSARDSLTRLFNHEKFYEILEEHMNCYAENKTPFSIIIADIDNFKKVNDTYGHAFGDEVIKKLSQIMIECKGTKDVCARYGGEEFAVIIPNKELNEAVLQAERIRTTFQAFEFLTGDGNVHHFSISLGVAEYNKEYQTASAFFEMADKALYEAKESGKNRVCCSR